MEINFKKAGLVLGIILIVVLLFIGSMSYLIFNNLVGRQQEPQDSIAVININGPILGGSGGGMFSQGAANSERIMREINRAKNEENIKAIILNIESPGGSSAAAEAIHRELVRFKETGKPIVVSMGSIAASGGYYISTVADQIYANSSTLTGSIGVIMNLHNLEDLYDKLGIEPITFKSGPFKDIGNPNRELLAEEEEIIQNLVDRAYENFVQVIVEGRELDEEKVKEIADGRIYDGSEAQELGLVDELGTFYDAKRQAAQLAGIEAEPNLVYYGRPSLLERILSSANKLSYALGLTENLAEQLKLSEEELIYYQFLERESGNNLWNLELNY
ncbi:signal peptide peptidase SppA [Fuchsiella alkaliacetigena]|uniref:signal peptide peptidase SppA n=1 Tax=Fuchsiella alkaliacetigena TaxID=957042 RepID=UPI00200A94A0|nr:signal peptide peptidase SppA [Fuchsiella alkaliacetigena]MCK8824519.1 signal peptide peptidase SppA [Fuchsiella alkaliacetigena]